MPYYTLKRLLQEPLLHFLLVGFLLFLVYDLKQGQQNKAPNRIVVTTQQAEQLSARFKLTKLRPPTQAEQNALIEDYVRDEVFYREALAMGLDQNDPQVRKQMRIKLEYFLEELSTNTLTDELLKNYLKQHPEKFQTDAQFSFQQLYINPEKHQNPQTVASKLLLRLKNGEDENTLGDRTALQPDFILATSREVDNYLGAGVAAQIEQLKKHEWAGPITSSYGLHLIKVSDYLAGQLPDFDDIRNNVERKYTAQQRTEQKDQAYQLMRKRYQVVNEASAG